MELTLATSQLAVYDNVLAPDAFAHLLAYIESEDYSGVHSEKVLGVLRPEDGYPLHRKKLFFWLPVPLGTLVPREDLVVEARKNIDFYPTQTPMDALFEAMTGKAIEHKELLGEVKKDWLAASGKIFVYPAGTGISWHWDADIYAGAFIFYAHPVWDPQWGGELLIGDPSSAQTMKELITERSAENARLWAGKTKPVRKHNFGTGGVRDDAIMKRGIGQFVAPKPNRLVILRGNNPHMVSKVSPAAGHHCRLSVAGFFTTPAGLKQMLEPVTPKGAK